MFGGASLEINPFASVPRPHRGSSKGKPRSTLTKDLPLVALLFVDRHQEEYLSKSWTNTEELYWVGKYASDAHKVFIERKWREVQPNDHALNWWVEWMRGTPGGVSPPAVEKLMDLWRESTR